MRLLKEPGARDALNKLCAAGCDRERFLRLLLAISTIIFFDTEQQRIPGKPHYSRSTFPNGKELTKLCTDIERLATRIERANADPIVSPIVVLDALTKPRDHQTDKAYKRQIAFYNALPVMLRLYAGDVCKSFKFVVRKLGPKRFSFERYWVLQLLEYVQAQTGQPHYEPVQLLLESAFRVTVGEGTPVPKLLESPDALKQLWARSLKYGFRKKDTSHPILKLKS